MRWVAEGGEMARYFFNLQDGNAVLRDDLGEEFNNVEEARNHAVQVATELARNRPERIRAQQRLLITDASGVELFQLPLLLEPV
jgi:uncharacterized protein DUF6894